MSHLTRRLVLVTPLVFLGCKGGTSQTDNSDPLVDRMVQALIEKREVMAKVKIEVRPGAPKEERRVKLAAVDFDENGAIKTFRLKDGATMLNLPAAAFRSALLRNSVTIDGKPVS